MSSRTTISRYEGFFREFHLRALVLPTRPLTRNLGNGVRWGIDHDKKEGRPVSTLRDAVKGTRILDLGPLPAPSLPVNATAQQALQQLVRSRRGAVVITDEDDRAVGVLSERDVLYGLCTPELATSASRRRLAIRDIMSSPATTIRQQATLQVALDTMSRMGYRNLVVVDRHQTVRGLLTSNDVMQFLSDQFPEQTVNLPPHLHQSYSQPEGA